MCDESEEEVKEQAAVVAADDDETTDTEWAALQDDGPAATGDTQADDKLAETGDGSGDASTFL